MSHQLIIPPEIEHEIAQIFDSIHSSDRALSFIHDLNVLFERIVERPFSFRCSIPQYAERC